MSILIRKQELQIVQGEALGEASYPTLKGWAIVISSLRDEKCPQPKRRFVTIVFRGGVGRVTFRSYSQCGVVLHRLFTEGFRERRIGGAV